MSPGFTALEHLWLTTLLVTKQQLLVSLQIVSNCPESYLALHKK